MSLFLYRSHLNMRKILCTCIFLGNSPAVYYQHQLVNLPGNLVVRNLSRCLLTNRNDFSTGVLPPPRKSGYIRLQVKPTANSTGNSHEYNVKLKHKNSILTQTKHNPVLFSWKTWFFHIPPLFLTNIFGSHSQDSIKLTNGNKKQSSRVILNQGRRRMNFIHGKIISQKKNTHQIMRRFLSRSCADA